MLAASTRLSTNITKGRYLEQAIKQAYEICKIAVEDFTSIFNFLSPNGKHVPDFVAANHLAEGKNWWCNKYSIDFNKAEHEIEERAANFPHLLKILVIAKPKWLHGVKEWLIAKGWTIVELGYEVTPSTQRKAIKDIVEAFKRIRVCNIVAVDAVVAVLSCCGCLVCRGCFWSGLLDIAKGKAGSDSVMSG